VWFSVVVPPTGRLVLDTDDVMGTPDLVMALYQTSAANCSSTFGMFACDDNNSLNGTNLPKLDIWGLIPSSTVYVRIWGKTGTTGAFQICASCPPPIAGVVSPATFSTCTGQSVTFTLSGHTSLGTTLQWQQSTDGGTTWTNVASATSATLSVSPTVGIRYRVAVSGCTTVNSTVGIIIHTATAPPTASTVSASLANVCKGSSSTLTATGGTGTGYQWQQSTDAGVTWTDFGGGLTTQAVSPTVATQYRVIRTNASCQPSSASAAVTVGVNCLNMQAGNTTSCGLTFYDSGGSGGSYSNNEALVHTFYPNGSGAVTLAFSGALAFSGNGANLCNDNMLIYDGPNNTFPIVGVYCNGDSPGNITSTHPSGALTVDFASNNSGTNNGWSAALSCCAVLGGSITPTQVCASTTIQTFTLSGHTAGSTFQWQQSTNAGSTWTNIAGATSATYNTGSVSPGASGITYRVRVTNGGCTVSSQYTIISRPADGGSVSPSTSTLCTSQAQILTNYGGTGNYQWQQSTDGLTWTNVVGATLSTYSFSTATAGIYYLRVQRNSGGCIANSTSLTVNVVACNDVTLNAATNGTTVNTCGTRFYDSGGSAGNYGNSENRTVTICPSTAGQKIQIDFNTFVTQFALSGPPSNILVSDSLQIFNGNSTSSPLLTTYAGDRTSLGLALTSSASDGCLTFRFISNTSTVGSGWDANVSCVAAINCGSNVAASDFCTTSTPICNLNGYCGNTFSYTASASDPSSTNTKFCGSVENSSWLSFVASATTTVLDVRSGTCDRVAATQTTGIQMQLYSLSGDCTVGSATNYTAVGTCYSTGLFQNFSILATGLTVGQTYYLMVDGYANAQCSYSVTINSGATNTPVNAGPDQTICPGTSATLSATGGGSSDYNWYTGGSSGTLVGTGATITVSPSATTTYTAVNISGPTGLEDNVVVTVNNTSNTLAISPTIGYYSIGSFGIVMNVSGGSPIGGTYSWSPATGLSSTSGTTVIANPSTPITYTVTYTAPNGCISQITTVASPGIPLSDRVIALQAQTVADNIILHWKVTPNHELKHFVVERANKDLVFKSLGQTNVVAQELAYSLVDDSPMMGTNYYRLHIFDNKGNHAYSPVVQATIDNDLTRFVKVYPIPTSSNGLLNIDYEVGNTGDIIFKILTMSYVQMHEYKVKVERLGTHQTTLKLPPLSVGIYLLQLQDKMGRRKVTKIIVQ
jgi:hypothetical protein